MRILKPLVSLFLIYPLLAAAADELPEMDAETAADFGFTAQSNTAAQPVTMDSEIQSIIWHGTPLQIPLSAGQERRLIFDRAVEIGIDPGLAGSLSPQVYGNSVLLTATEPMPVTRILVRELAPGGATYPLDLHISAEPGWTSPLRIVNLAYQPEERSSTDNELPPEALPRRQRPGYAALTRYAAQQLYAPQRLIEEPESVSRIRITREEVRLMRYEKVQAIPLAAWQSQGLYVTAVKLTNLRRTAIDLDPRELFGAWDTATFQHARLGPKGTPVDSTAVYLTSRERFESALGVEHKKGKPARKARGNAENRERR